MSGKKVTVALVIAMIITSVGMSLWIKQAYDSRPQVKIEEVAK